MKQRIPTLLAGACLAIPLHALGAADLLVVNARIFTANPQQPFAEALAVEDGRIWRDVDADAEPVAFRRALFQLQNAGG
ncbi:amidohydrolase, partial [Pseudomonas aeruginosa]|nr:amidohydrolase [Pseudomonas aeruginosa]